MSERPLRKAFMRRLRTKVYIALSKNPLIETWKFTEIVALADSIVKSKKDEVNNYLDTHEITLANAEKAIAEILEKILLPEIEKMRI